MSAIFEDDFIIRISHIDKNNKLSSVGILSLLQEIAGYHSNTVGYGLNNIDSTHLSWIILNWKLKIFSRPKWLSKLHIKTWPRKTDKLHSYRDFEVFDQDNNLVAIASSKWVLVNSVSKSLVRISDEVKNAYELYDKKVFDVEIDKLKEVDNFDSSLNIPILRRDIDVNGHVNNLYYLYYAYESLPENIYENDFSEIEIMYKKECKYGEDIVVLYKNISETEHQVTIKSKDLEHLHCIVKFKK